MAYYQHMIVTENVRNPQAYCECYNETVGYYIEHDCSDDVARTYGDAKAAAKNGERVVVIGKGKDAVMAYANDSELVVTRADGQAEGYTKSSKKSKKLMKASGGSR